MTVTISDPATSTSRSGYVSSVGQRTATSDSISGGVYVPMTVIPDSPLPTSMIGQDVALTIAAAHSAGLVLAVPEAAIFARANGLIYVTKVTRARSDLEVPVRIGVIGDGMVGITPIDGGTLAAGDSGVTGVNYARIPARLP